MKFTIVAAKTSVVFFYVINSNLFTSQQYLLNRLLVIQRNFDLNDAVDIYKIKHQLNLLQQV